MRDREFVRVDHEIGELPTVNSPGLPRLIGPMTCGRSPHEAHEAVDQVVHVAEGPGLAPVPIDGDVSSLQRLNDEVRYDATVVRPHARTIGVEDAAP